RAPFSPLSSFATLHPGSSSGAPAGRAPPQKKEPDDSPHVTALKTPRQVTPSLIDVSASDQLHSISRSQLAVTDRALPLSSAIAHARQEQIDAADATLLAAHEAKVFSAYAHLDIRKVELV
ncbi:unnamed protein product, partial [Laminaria digitata]